MTEKKLILRSQAASIAEGLRAADLSPAEFAWTEETSRMEADSIVSKLTHVATGYYFQFDFIRGNQHYFYCAPGDQAAVGNGWPKHWENLQAHLADWIRNVKTEVDTPDPWSQFFSATDLIEQGQQQTAGNEPFSDAEYRDLTRRLEEVRAFLLDHAEDDAARDQTNAKIDYLVTKARTTGRSDWFFMAMGVLLTEVVRYVLDSEGIRHVFELLVRGVQQLTGG